MSTCLKLNQILISLSVIIGNCRKLLDNKVKTQEKKCLSIEKTAYCYIKAFELIPTVYEGTISRGYKTICFKLKC